MTILPLLVASIVLFPKGDDAKQMKEIKTLEKLKNLKDYMDKLDLDETNIRSIKKDLDFEIEYAERQVYLTLGKTVFDERNNGK